MGVYPRGVRYLEDGHIAVLPGKRPVLSKSIFFFLPWMMGQFPWHSGLARTETDGQVCVWASARMCIME